MTVEKAIDAVRPYSRSLNYSTPRYIQFGVRVLIVSKSHQPGTDARNSPVKSSRLHVRIDVPRRRFTIASTTKA